jgi:hypothetical protein
MPQKAKPHIFANGEMGGKSFLPTITLIQMQIVDGGI